MKGVLMGASFTIFLLFPLFFIIVIPGMILDFATGNAETEIILPYEPEKGTVWECCLDDQQFKLVETEVDGNNQIFYIRPNIFSNTNSEHGQLSKIIFTDENKNEKTYYVRNNSDTPEYFDLYVYAPGEYVDFDYTVKPEKPVHSYSWHVQIAESKFVLYNPDVESEETTFTVVHPLDDNTRSYYTIGFYYGPHSGDSKEGYNITYTVTENGAEITKESHDYYD